MFFAGGLRKNMSSLLSTHPDLATRIKRIDPSFNGTFNGKTENTASFTTETQSRRSASALSGTMGAVQNTAIMNSIGTVSSENVTYAREVLHSIPAGILRASRELYSARLIVYVLLIDSNHDIRRKQFQMLSDHLPQHEYTETKRLITFKEQITPYQRLPILELALSTLAEMAPAQYAQYSTIIDLLINADNRVDAFEFVVRQFTKRQYNKISGKRMPRTNVSVSRLRPEIQLILSMLAYSGSDDTGSAEMAFQKGIDAVFPDANTSRRSLTLVPITTDAYCELDSAVDRLSGASYKIKRSLIQACIDCILYDTKVTVGEYELVRAYAEMLGVPVPPHIAVTA